MEFLIIILFVVLIAAAMPKPNTQISLKDLGVCPPHKWRHVEIKDHEGVTHSWKMVCDVCGPLKPLDAPDRSLQ